MKKVMLTALVAGIFMIGSVYAQTTPAPAAKPAKQENTMGTQTDKPAKKHHKGKGKKKAGAAKSETKPAEQK